MTKKAIILLLIVCIMTLNNNCNNPSEVKKEPSQIAFISFENENELNNWNLGSSNGHAELDQNVKFSGSQSIHLSPDNGCYVIDRKVGIEVQSGKRYSISFNVIIGNDQNHSYCAGDLILTLKQGNEEILYESVFDAPDWEQKTYYFIANNDLPVNINFIIGENVWLDDISMIHELN